MRALLRRLILWALGSERAAYDAKDADAVSKDSRLS